MAENPLKVFHLIKALGRGGAEVLLAETLRVADREGFDYSYGYLQSRPDDVAGDLRALGARVDCFQMDNHWEMIVAAKRIARHVVDHGIELIHAHLPVAGIVARIAGRIANVPVVYTEHSLLDRYHPVVRLGANVTWRWQRQVFAISQDVAESIRRHCGEGVPICVVWNGVDTDKFAPGAVDGDNARNSLGITSDALVVGTVAVLRNSPAKRIDIWLDAARIILECEPRTTFIIVGDGSQRRNLEERAKALGLGDAVYFVGKQKDVRPYLAAFDVFMMSSEYEGFGIAPVEAMAMGVPVVATDVAGIRNIISSGESGILCRFDGDVAGRLAESAVQLLKDPAMRNQLGMAGRRVAVERFSVRRLQAQLEASYESIVGRRVRASAGNRPGPSCCINTSVGSRAQSAQ